MVMEVFRQLGSTSSKLDKVRILQENDSPLLRRVLNYALDPYRQFYIKKIPGYVLVGGKDLDWALDKLDALSNREVTGRAASTYLSDVLSSLDEDDCQVLIKVIAKDLKCGTAVGTVNKAFPKLVPKFEVQLCAEFNPDRVKFPVTVEPKYDGLRGLAFIENRVVTFYSRGGKVFETLDDIAAELLWQYPDGTVIDGELVSGRFQSSMSAIRRHKANKKDAEILFFVFDRITIEEFRKGRSERTLKSRRTMLRPESFNEDGPIRHNYPHVVHSVEELMAKHNEFLELGWEGTIVKDENSLYECKRSPAWMKVKPFETADVQIIGFQEGTGKYEGSLGALMVEFEGIECKIGTGFSDKLRDEIWQNRDEWLGTTVEMEFMERTDGGKSRHARFIKQRTYKGEKA